MFPDQNTHYASSQSSRGDSANFSFSSCSSIDTSFTPPTRRESFDSSCLDDQTYINYGDPSDFTMTGGNHALGDYQMQMMLLEQQNKKRAMSGRQAQVGQENAAQVSGISNMTFDIDYDKLHQEPPMFNYHPLVTGQEMFHSFHGLQIVPDNMPSLVPDLQSPLSDMASSQGDFINPSQTFMDAYDPQSPASLLQYSSSPVSEYGGVYPSYVEDVRSCTTTPSKPSPLRQPTLESLETSAALHRVQSDSHERRLYKRTKRENSFLGNNVRFQGKAKKPCTWPGCSQKFQRQEHLKRHEKTHTNTEYFPCEFCPKSFGRSDNLKSHIKLHADPPKKSSRTIHYDAAIEVYESMNRRAKRSTESKISNVKLDPDSPSKTMRSRAGGI